MNDRGPFVPYFQHSGEMTSSEKNGKEASASEESSSWVSSSYTQQGSSKFVQNMKGLHCNCSCYPQHINVSRRMGANVGRPIFGDPNNSPGFSRNGPGAISLHPSLAETGAWHPVGCPRAHLRASNKHTAAVSRVAFRGNLPGELASFKRES